MAEALRLIVEAGVCYTPALGEQSLRDLVRRITEAARMTLLRTMTVDVPLDLRALGREPYEDEGGVSAVGVLSTSHVAVHAWPLRREAHVDLYSCRAFHPSPVLDAIVTGLRPGKMRWQAQDIERSWSPWRLGI